MRTPLHHLCLPALLLCILLPTATVRGQLVTNGDFETGAFTGWNVTHAASNSFIQVVHGTGPDTTYGVFFAATGSTFDTISQNIVTVPGAFYTFSFFYQVANTMAAANNEFRALFDGNILYDNVNANPGFGTFTFTVQATTALTTIEFDGRNKPASDFLDNVSVNAVAAVPETGSTFAILSLGLSALALFRRRIWIAR